MKSNLEAFSVCDIPRENKVNVPLEESVNFIQINLN